MRTLLSLAAALALFGCNANDAREVGGNAGRLASSVGEAAGDAQLVARVNAALAQRKGVDMSGLRVEAEKGVVTLGGHVRTAEERRTVRDTVDGIRGVRSVVDNLRIQPN